MGDRTYVELTVLNEHAAAAQKLFNFPAQNDECTDGVTTTFGFEKVNYGTLDFLDKLRDAGIPYNSRWSSGDEYEAGTEYCRYTSEGICDVFEVNDSEESSVDLKKLLELIQRQDVTVDHIRTWVADHQQAITPLPWEGQLDNVKKFLTLKLIGA